jgi:putative DNA primase/helicase
MLWGGGQNGKSTLVNILSYILGDYGSEMAIDSIIEKKFDNQIPNDVAALAGLRLVSTSENKQNARLDSAKIKKLTSGENISARFLHCEWFKFRPAFTIWMSTNHRPSILDDSDGIWRRVKLVPFLMSFKGTKEDKQLESKLRSEASGILNWFLQGLEDYQQAGIREPATVTRATAEYRTGEDSLTRFLQDETKAALNTTECTQATAVYARFRLWAERKKEFLLTERKFNEAMDSHGVESSFPHNKKMFRLRLNPYPSWLGPGDDCEPTIPDDDDEVPSHRTIM